MKPGLILYSDRAPLRVLANVDTSAKTRDWEPSISTQATQMLACLCCITISSVGPYGDPKIRLKSRIYFIKTAHRRNHSRVKLTIHKKCSMHLRKKCFQIFRIRNPDPEYRSGLHNFRILKIF